MSKQNSFIANPLNDSSSDDNGNVHIRDGQSNQEQDGEICSKNPLESDDDEGNESSVLQHLINNDQDHSSQSDEISNPMMEQDPISLDNVLNQHLASIGQQYHVCQTVLDCNKTIEVQQEQNQINSCDELLEPRLSNKDNQKEIIQNLQNQLEQLQKENSIFKKHLVDYEINYTEKIKIKDDQIVNLNKLNQNLHDENTKLKGQLQNQEIEIQSLKQQIKINEKEKNIQQRSKTGAETTRAQFPQELNKATSLNDYTIATLSANQLEIRKIPTLSIDIPFSFSGKPKLANKNQFVYQNGTSDLNDPSTEKSKTSRLHKIPKNQKSLQDLIHKAQIGIAFQKSNTSSLQKVQGQGQLYFESKSSKQNQQQMQATPKQ